MNHTDTEHAAARRQAVVAAKHDLINAMTGHELTAMEWVAALSDVTTRMIGMGLIEQWEEDRKCES